MAHKQESSGSVGSNLSPLERTWHSPAMGPTTCSSCCGPAKKGRFLQAKEFMVPPPPPPTTTTTTLSCFLSKSHGFPKATTMQLWAPQPSRGAYWWRRPNQPPQTRSAAAAWTARCGSAPRSGHRPQQGLSPPAREPIEFGANTRQS